MEGGSEEGGSAAVVGEANYKTYPRRWLVMASIMTLNIFGYCLSISFGPVASQASEYYQVPGPTIDLIPLVALAVNMPGMFVAVYCIDRFGVKVGVRWGASCMLVGSLVRLFSTMPGLTDQLRPVNRFWLTFAGQAVMAMGHPFLITMSTKVSQVWFSERERIFTTAAMAGAAAFGAMIGSLLAPVIVSSSPSNIPLLNIIFPACMLAGVVAAWTTVNAPHPPTPPSLSAQKLREKPLLTVRQFFENIKQLLSNSTILNFILLMGGGIGIFNMLGTQLGQLMCPTGYSEQQAGIAAGVTIFTGLIGSFIVGPLARRWGKQEEVTKLSFSLSTMGIIFLTMALRKPDIYWAILLCLSMFGFFGLGAFPIILELAVEESYPADPVISEAFIHMCGQAQAIALILLGNVMVWDPTEEMLLVQKCRVSDDGLLQPYDYTPYFYFLMAAGFVVGVCFIIFINPTLRRSAADRGK